LGDHAHHAGSGYKAGEVRDRPQHSKARRVHAPPVENNSKAGDAVYDPFSGSGTTIIAGEMTARSVYAIELSPAYVDVAVLRWQAFTSRDAIHEPTGQTFAQRSKAHGRQAAA